MKKTKKFLQVGTMVALVMGTSFAALPSFADSTVSIPGSATPNLQDFTDLGAAPSDATMNVIFYLKVNNSNGLANAVRTHQNMTANDFHTNYSPSANDYNAVLNQLKKAGLTINSTTDNNLAIDATGTVAQLQSLLGTSIHQFKDKKGNITLANTTDYQVSGALAAHLAGTTGVDQFSLPHPLLVNKNNASANNESTTMQSSTASAQFFNGTNSSFIQKAYNYCPAYNQGLDGTDHTIAIVDAYGSPTALQDLQQYNQQVEAGADKPLNLTVIAPPTQHRNGQQSAQLQTKATLQKPAKRCLSSTRFSMQTNKHCCMTCCTDPTPSSSKVPLPATSTTKRWALTNPWQQLRAGTTPPALVLRTFPKL